MNKKNKVKKMRAAVYTKYGSPDVLEVIEIEKPVPKKNEVLVKILATSIQFADWRFVLGKPFIIRLMGSGLFRPKHKVMGSDIAGIVEKVGKEATKFKIGDEIFGDISDYGWGGFAQYVCVPEDAICLKPDNISFEMASAVPQSAEVALQGIRDAGKIQSEQKVLIIGASGGIGTFAIQICKFFDAIVTGVCSTENVKMVYSIGADRVIDYKKEDFTKLKGEFDIVFDIIAKNPVPDYLRVLKEGGIYVAGALNLNSYFKGRRIAKKEKKTIKALVAKTKIEDLELLKKLIEEGSITPIVDKCFPLEEIANAIKYYSERHAKGKIVIKIEH